MSYNQYGRGPNPYAQQDNFQPYGQQQQAQYNSQPYGGAPSPSYGAQTIGRDDYSNQNHEMVPLTPNGAQFGTQGDPKAFFKQCTEIDGDIEDISRAMERLSALHQRALDDTSGKFQNVDVQSAEIFEMFRNVASRLKSMKQQPDSPGKRSAQQQIGRVDRKLRELKENYLSIDATFQRKLKDQTARQFRIARPDASEDEVRQAVEDGGGNVFVQAMMQNNRSGQATSTMNAVKQRNAEIKKIEEQMIQLGQMFEDMDNLVMEQEHAVVNIETKGEEVVDNMDKGTQEIGTAIKSAKNARKWKWWCLGICVAIVAIIVIVVLIYKFVIQDNKPAATAAKRFYIPFTEHRVVSGQPWTPVERDAVPGLDWNGKKLVVRRFKA